MFTGIIQTLGAVESREEAPAGVTFVVRAAGLALSPGDSIAVNGVCHTVERTDGEAFAFTSVGETLARTTLDELAPGARVNLEPAATPTTALGGHIVQGHVDGVGRVESFERMGQDYLLSISVPEAVHDCLVEKGSIAVDGISLTVVDLKPDRVVTITIIPFTREHTIVDNYARGTRVNIEADVLGKYVKKFMERLNK